MKHVALALIFGASSMAFASEVVTETEEVKVEETAVEMEEAATDAAKEDKLSKEDAEKAEGETTATAPVETPEKG